MLGAGMKRQDGRAKSNFLYRWLSSDAAMYAALFVLGCLLLVYLFFAISFKYFD
jgi:hypothetical protein